MAMNPMQRKIRNSFLFGFLVAIIISAVLISLMYMKVNSLKQQILEAQKAAEVATKQVYAIKTNVEKDEILTASEGAEAKIEEISVPSQCVPDNAITEENIKNYATAFDKDGKPTEYQIKSKLALSKSTIITTDMIERSAESGTYRLGEYTMISLPSKLQKDDYIDIRIAYPTSADFVVLSKIKVQDCNTNTMWLKLSESQMLLLNNAIVESYIIEGTKLYATQYIDAAQVELNSTYVPNSTVVSLMQANSFTEYDATVVSDARKDAMDIRKYIESVLANYTDDERTTKVNEGYTTEKTTVQAAREALMGDLGY